jgi:FkbM family methyltransferase
MSSALKKSFKRLLFSLHANSRVYVSIYKLYLNWFYKPSPKSLAALISEFSASKKELTFVQVGANDGFYHDPIYKFIVRDKWRGVMLEPLPFVYNEFLAPLHRNRPNVVALNAALDYADGEHKIYKIAFSNSRWATGLTSFKKEVLENVISSGHVARCCKRYGETLPEKIEDYIAEETIQCISPAKLLSQYQLQKLDWLQIDAEGYDFEIIKMFDIANTRPEVIVFENSHLSQADKQTCEKLLTDNGYQISYIKENTIARRKA